MNSTLFEKILNGTASEREYAELNRWLRASDTNRAYFEQLKLIWKHTQTLPQGIEVDEAAAFERIMVKAAKRNLVRRRARARIYIGLAAASILLLLGISTFFFRINDQYPGRTVSYTAREKIEQVHLDDGTIVWLNTNSTLVTPVRFSRGQRKVQLTGEAYFEVARNEAKPFKIKAGKTVTKVLGTSFNIKMDTIQGCVSVAVNSGKVAFYPKGHSRKGVLLLPGDLASFDPSNREINKTKNSNLNYLAWKTHILTFQSTPLKEVCKVLSDYYQKPVTTNLFADKYVITGKFERESMEDILSTIQLTLDVNIEETDHQIVIHK